MPIEDGANSIGQIDAASGFQLFLQSLGFLGLALLVLVAIAAGVGWLWIIWMRNKNRKKNP